MTNIEFMKLIETRQSLRAQLDTLSEQLTSIKDAIKAEMNANDTELVEAGNYTVRWTKFETSRFDSTAFKKVHADLYKAFTQKVPTRRFTISEASN